MTVNFHSLFRELQPIAGRAEARERGEYSRDYSRESSRDYSMSGRKVCVHVMMCVCQSMCLFCKALQ